MTDLNPIIADRFTEHLEVFGKTMEHMDTIGVKVVKTK